MTEDERYIKEIIEQEQREAEYQEYLRYVEETQMNEEYFRQLRLEEQFEIRHLGGLIPDELPLDFFTPIDDE